MISLFVPCTLIGFLAVCGLYLPTDPSGARMERYRYGLTAVLSLIIFQLGLYERLPVSNDGVPVLSVFYSVLFATICSATCTTSVPIAIHRQALKGRTYPNYLMWILPKKYRDRHKREAARRQREQQALAEQHNQQPDSNGGDTEAAVTSNGPSTLHTKVAPQSSHPPNWNVKVRGVSHNNNADNELCQRLCPVSASVAMGDPPPLRL